MIRIDQMMVAEIGTWQNFPAHSGLRRTLMALAARADALRIAQPAAPRIGGAR